jgi:hypothetical protein
LSSENPMLCARALVLPRTDVLLGVGRVLAAVLRLPMLQVLSFRDLLLLFPSKSVLAVLANGFGATAWSPPGISFLRKPSLPSLVLCAPGPRLPCPPPPPSSFEVGPRRPRERPRCVSLEPSFHFLLSGDLNAWPILSSTASSLPQGSGSGLGGWVEAKWCLRPGKLVAWRGARATA